ncbi:MAG TPA: glycosyltransferase family 4 protein, partial [Solirubrobacterales bacterium]|nr:glycosyltransferase family 4 protein [Solirubrobacterales bacterium]
VNHTSRISGGEISLLTLLEALPGDVEPAVACPEGELARRLRAAGARVLPIRGTDGSLRLHPSRTPRALLEIAAAALGVRRAGELVGADVVHANSIRAGIVTAAAAIGAGRATVAHVRDCLPAGALSAISLRAIGRCDAVIANSEYTRSTLGAAAAGATVIHNAVDLDRFAAADPSPAAARARLGLAAEGPVLAVVAQITPWKGQDDAIRIAALLKRSHPRLRLLLVGSAKFDSAATRYDNRAYLESLRRQVAAAGLQDTVLFLGERDDVPEVLRAADLLLAPSWEEPFGRSIVEAMATGTPVAATAVGGPPEILGDGEGAAGLLLPPRQPQRWAEAIGELLAEPERLRRMGAAASEAAASRFGVERHAAAVLALYERVLSSST